MLKIKKNFDGRLADNADYSQVNSNEDMECSDGPVELESK